MGNYERRAICDRRYASRLLACSAIMLSIPAVAHAQAVQPVASGTQMPSAEVPASVAQAPATSTDAGDGIETIVVTARKINEDLQRTPISITAVTAAQLESRGVTSIGKIAAFTPNLTFQNTPTNGGPASNAAIYLRGIGQNDFAPSVEPGVGLYLDGVYIGTPVGSFFDLVDVERIEVLRGPQGTLFGKNTIGGAVSISTIQPNDTFSARGDVKYGTDDRINVRGYVNIPLTDTLFAKISGGLFSQDGYVKAPFEGNGRRKFGNQDSKTIRGALRWQATPTLDLTLSGDYATDKSFGAPTVITGVGTDPGQVALNNLLAVGNPALCFAPANATNPSCYNQQYFSRDTNFSSGSNVSDIKSHSASFVAKWDVADNMTLKSISAYREVKGYFSRDGDGSPLPIQKLFDFYKQEQYSQELQLTGKAFDSKLDYVLGGFYLRSKGRNINPVRFLILSADAGGTFDYDTLAGFAQGTFHFDDKLSLTGGIRFTQDNKSFSPLIFINSTLKPFLDIPPGTFLAPPGDYENNNHKWTPMANLSYQATPSILTYLTYSQGFKGGGYTQRLTAVETSLPSFRPETVTSYEAGTKLTAFDRRVRLNLAGFHMIYDKVQLLVANASRIAPFYTNAGKAHINGFEAEGEFAPGDGLRFTATAGLTDAQYKRLDGSVQGLTLQSRFVLVSKWTVSAAVEKAFTLSDDSRITPRVDWAYRSGFFTNVGGINDPRLYQPGYSLFSAALRWRRGDDRLNVAVGVDNIGDKKFRTFGTYQPAFGFYSELFDRGRQWYVQTGVQF